MSEGSLGAPTRHPIEWMSEDYTNPEKVDAEMRRVLDICHGCRRCFNLCDSFPRLFDLVDESATGELDSVDSKDFSKVVEACTLCDLCFMTKCPYVPPHEFNLDFPHLMLRYRAMERAQGKQGFVQGQLSETDRNGQLAGKNESLVNWATKSDNGFTRPIMEFVAGISQGAVLPKFHAKTLMAAVADGVPKLNKEAPAYGRKAVIYATCFGNYNDPDLGLATRAVLAHNGIEAKFLYEGCCGMPKLEQGDLAAVAKSAEHISKILEPWIDKGYDIISPVPSCSLMMKHEWPLILPDNIWVKRLSEHVQDLSEYMVALSKAPGLAPGMTALPPVTLHVACHARAQNIGNKGVELLQLTPDNNITVIERCSGHGGTWGMMKKNNPVAKKVGKPVIQKAAAVGNPIIVSECPLAAAHIAQGVGDKAQASHPIKLIAQSYKLNQEE